MASVSMSWVRDGHDWGGGGRPEWVWDDHSVIGVPMSSVGVSVA